MATEAGNVEIRLLDARRHSGRGPATLNITNYQRHLRHNCPAERLGLERDPRTARAGYRNFAGITRADGHRDRSDFIFALHEGPAVLRKLATQNLHYVRPRRNGITRAETHASRDDAVGQRLIAIHDDLLAAFALAINEFESLE